MVIKAKYPFCTIKDIVQTIPSSKTTYNITEVSYKLVHARNDSRQILRSINRHGSTRNEEQNAKEVKNYL